jgi:hypothetical protein
MNISRPVFTDGMLSLPESESPALGLADSPAQRKNSRRLTPALRVLAPAEKPAQLTAILSRYDSREQPVLLLLALAGVAGIVLAFFRAFGS